VRRVQLGQRSRGGWHQDAGSPDHSGDRGGRGWPCSARATRRTAGCAGAPVVPKARLRHDDPAFRDLDGNFDLCLVTGLPRSGGHDRRAVVFGHVSISPVDGRLVKAGFGHAGLQIVADHLCGHPAKEAEGATMRPDPVRQTLAPTRLGIRSGSKHQGLPRTTGPDEPRPCRRQ